MLVRIGALVINVRAFATGIRLGRNLASGGIRWRVRSAADTPAFASFHYRCERRLLGRRRCN
jgi:hypothetical protein